MEIQYYGANCLSITYKNTRLVIDDNLSELGSKPVLKEDNVAIYTMNDAPAAKSRLIINGAGEYEVGSLSIVGIDTTPFMNDDSKSKSTMYRISTSDIDMLVLGHVLGELSASELEAVGKIDFLFIPVGNNGYTLDAVGASKLIKDLEPKVVIPTHYNSSKVKYQIPQDDLSKVLKELAMEPNNIGSKLKLKTTDLSDITQLFVLDES